MSTSPEHSRPAGPAADPAPARTRSNNPARTTVLSASLAAVTLATLTGCVIGTPDSDRGGETAPQDAGQATVVTVTGSAPAPTVAGTPGAASSTVPADTAPGPVVDIGVPYSLTYLDNGVPVTGGELEGTLAAPGPVAWSTSKVPVAVAALRAVADGTSLSDDATVRANVTSAITASDNAAAQALWDSLGDPAAAGAATEAVLRDGGDTTTRVQTTVTRPGLTSFGQTVWTTQAQARFAAGLQCLAGAGPVLTAMGQISAGQDYGLGRIPGAVFKGGWGPDLSGAYQVRQFGLVPGADGTLVPVALEVVSADGSYASGSAALDTLVDRISGVLAGAHGVSGTAC
ncbi:hypothetical protein [Corynebacterium neomassiliense]|uniref:hypothetical protein n=1 Tax=Corynebacterium neomassiliense TaxID=2079482 RepID=UPI001F442CD7|nr:hypothetical protein [Corynebacterium neomassiliense]